MVTGDGGKRQLKWSKDKGDDDVDKVFQKHKEDFDHSKNGDERENVFYDEAG